MSTLVVRCGPKAKGVKNDTIPVSAEKLLPAGRKHQSDNLIWKNNTDLSMLVGFPIFYIFVKFREEALLDVLSSDIVFN